MLGNSFVRILVVLFFLCSLLISSVLKANLTTFLSEVPPKKGVHDIDSLRRHAKSDGIVGICILTNIRNFFEVHTALKLGVVPYAWPLCPLSNNADLKQPGLVFLADDRSSRNISATPPADYIRAQEFPFSRPYGPFMKRMSNVRVAITAILSQSIEAGVFERFVELESYQREAKIRRPLRQDKNGVTPFSISDFKLLILVCGVGILFASVALAGELFFSYYRISFGHNAEHQGRVFPVRI